MKEHAAVILAENLSGTILKCPSGCIHLKLGNITITLCEPQFRAFAELMFQSSMKLAKTHGAGIEQKPKLN